MIILSSGKCSIEDGSRVCTCTGNYYGTQCQLDGEVMILAPLFVIFVVVLFGGNACTFFVMFVVLFFGGDTSIHLFLSLFNHDPMHYAAIPM